jgi:hypothetical protein
MPLSELKQFLKLIDQDQQLAVATEWLGLNRPYKTHRTAIQRLSKFCEIDGNRRRKRSREIVQRLFTGAKRSDRPFDVEVAISDGWQNAGFDQ